MATSPNGRIMFDPSPLVRQVVLDMRPEIHDDEEYLDTSERIADMLGVSSRAVKRWKRGAWLTRTYADRLALKIGIMPEMLWEDWFD